MMTEKKRYDPLFLIRPYEVVVAGFPSMVYHASSRGKALSQSWSSYCGALGYISFMEFMKIAKTKPGQVEERYGAPIKVNGREAFFVGYNGHYVQFALPGKTNCSNSHPLDVTLATGEPFQR